MYFGVFARLRKESDLLTDGGVGCVGKCIEVEISLYINVLLEIPGKQLGLENHRSILLCSWKRFLDLVIPEYLTPTSIN